MRWFCCSGNLLHQIQNCKVGYMMTFASALTLDLVRLKFTERFGSNSIERR